MEPFHIAFNATMAVLLAVVVTSVTIRTLWAALVKRKMDWSDCKCRLLAPNFDGASI